MEPTALKYHVRFLLQGMPEEFLFAINEEDWQRSQRILYNHDDKDPKMFLNLKTIDGYYVVVRIKDIQMARFLWTPYHPEFGEEITSSFFAQAKREGDLDIVEVYFRGRTTPLEIYSSEPCYIGDLFTSCDGMNESQAGRIMSFEDEDGEPVFLQASQLMLWRVHASGFALGDVYEDE